MLAIIHAEPVPGLLSVTACESVAPLVAVTNEAVVSMDSLRKDLFFRIEIGKNIETGFQNLQDLNKHSANTVNPVKNFFFEGCLGGV